MAIFKQISAEDKKTQKSFLNQIIDILQDDVSGSATRRQYQAFVTGGVGPGVTSSLFQTVYDQDFTVQTANAQFDMTMGVFEDSTIVTDISTGEDVNGKLLFPSTSMMMREKVDLYRQFAQTLLGDAAGQFVAPFNSTAAADKIDAAAFIAFKRLFARDAMKRETFAMRMFRSASTDTLVPNVNVTSEAGSSVFTDVGSSQNKLVAYGGQVGDIVNSANTTETVGLIFYDRGVVVLDIEKIISGTQRCTGTIDAMNANSGAGFSVGQTLIGGPRSGNPQAKYVPDFITSASIDDIVDHFAACRFSSGSNTAFTFQNVTNINSTLVFCRASADEFNYSSNPTFVDSDSRIVVIDEGQEETQQTFTFVTTIGLYDANGNLLGVAKTSRPIEKNPERDLSFRLSLAF